MKIGLIREGKIPPDFRVPLIPSQCREILDKGLFSIRVQPSPIRCFTDEDYRLSGIRLQQDLSDCDVLLGVKEVPISMLIPGKTYFFFSHTIKGQSYNRELLQAILDKHIRLIDYEILSDEQGKRLIAFGKYAGMVGAHNGIMAYGSRTGQYSLPRMRDFYRYRDAVAYYQKTTFPAMKVVLTGTGRVGMGSASVLNDMGFRAVSQHDFLNHSFDGPVYVQLGSMDYVQRKDRSKSSRNDFHADPGQYESTFSAYTRVADVMLNGVFWDARGPAFFSKEEMMSEEFSIKVIGDITCDIAPQSSIPSTLRPSTIEDPIYGYDPHIGQETAPYQADGIDVMAVDNLPAELPRDASNEFGDRFVEKILPELLKNDSEILDRATICRDGRLTDRYAYLESFVADVQPVER